MAFVPTVAPRARMYKQGRYRAVSKYKPKAAVKARSKSSMRGVLSKIPPSAVITGGYRAYRYLRTRKYKTALTRKVPTAAGSTMSYYTCGSKTMPKLMRDLFKSNQVFETSALSSFRIDSNVYGRQFTGVRQLYSTATFNTDVTRASAPVNPTFNQIAASALYYSTMELLTTFTNMEMTTSYLDIYEIEPRFHIAAGSDPATLWESGLAYEGAASGSIDYVYETPFKSRTFCLFYKVKKIIKIELSPGQSHKHKATYHVNKRVDGAILEYYDIMRDMTKFQMYVVSGTPVNDATNNQLVSTSTVAMDVVNRLTYKYVRDAVIRDSYITTTALGPITTANVINDVTIKTDGEA